MSALDTNLIQHKANSP